MLLDVTCQVQSIASRSLGSFWTTKPSQKSMMKSSRLVKPSFLHSCTRSQICHIHVCRSANRKDCCGKSCEESTPDTACWRLRMCARPLPAKLSATHQQVMFEVALRRIWHEGQGVSKAGYCWGRASAGQDQALKQYSSSNAAAGKGIVGAGHEYTRGTAGQDRAST